MTTLDTQSYVRATLTLYTLNIRKGILLTVFPYIPFGADKENLCNNQQLLLLIIFFILMTLLHDSGVIL